MISFFGRFHPVFVHLPIGILMLAFILQFVARRKKSAALDHAIGISLLVGLISAVLSCITGFLLSRSDDYDEQLVSRHQWLGISVAIVTAILYWMQQQQKAVRWQWPVMIVLFLLVTVTGHLGGSLTHGSYYLMAPLTAMRTDSSATAQQAAIPNVQEAPAYAAIVQPILQAKCYSCHNKNKQKGGLRLDDVALFLKGGKNGVVLVPGNATESDLMKRIALPREDEDHMPPKEKPQLTDKEIALLHWWITSGASFDKKVNQLEQPDAIKPVLTALQKGPEEKKVATDIPAEPVEPADEAALQKLRALGVVVMPVARNNNYLFANFITATAITNNDLKLLLPLKKQLVWLKLGSAPITDSALSIVAHCDRISRLQLEHTAITDAGLQYLRGLKQLEYLNVVDTKVTAAGLMHLKELDKLQAVYCYQARVRPEDWAALKKAFPKVTIDSGGYAVPVLVTDTTLVKPPEPKK